jgi:PAS domain S-box-containing protein
MSESVTITGAPPSTRRGHGRRGEDLRHERLARLLSQVTEGILCLDRNWLVTFANEEAFRRSRITADDVNTKTYWEVYPDIVGTDLERAYREVMQTGITTHVEYFCEPIDLWVDVQVCPTDEGIALYYRDITARKRAEAVRDASVRQLQQVLEATTDAVVSLNRDWVFTFINRRAAELLSVKGDLIGKKIFEEFSSESLNHDYRLYAERAMYEGIAGEFEAFLPHSLNLWLSIQMRPSDDGIVIFFRDITHRKHSDEVLKQQRELLTAVQHAALVCTWEIDLGTGKVTFGSGSYPVSGHPLADIPDLESFLKIVNPVHVPLIQQAIQQTVATGEMIVIDTQVIAPDGHMGWVESRARAIHENDGTILLRGMSIDISSRKKNEEALTTSEARYRVLADLNPQAIWMGDAAGNLIYANQVYQDYSGLTMETLGDWLTTIVQPDDRARIAKAWSHSVSTGADYDVEARTIRARDGLTRWWWVRAQPVRDDAGNILHWLGVGIDIHDRKTFADTLQQRQEETERQRAELETIYRTAPIGLALFEPVEFRYLRVNDRQVETIGKPREEILGHKITEIAPLKGVKELFQQAASGHPVRNHVLEGELPARPGEHRTWNVSYSPVYNADGTVEAIAAAVHEITNQKKAEAALIQSEKLAAVGRLASSISHEINNPLEAITNLLYLISLSDDLPESVKAYVNTAQSELSRVCQIATQTLRFHRQAVRATDVNAEDLVGAVLNLYQGRLVNSNIVVDAKYSTTTTILCFENDIRQVLNNLIANAIDAMRQGGRIIVRAHDATDYSLEHPEGRKGIRITIADTGHGMSPTVRARLFEPFYTTKDLNGTGLGLWISNGIISRHQGRLTFRSTEHPVNHGSIFSLFLPCIELPPPDVEL